MSHHREAAASSKQQQQQLSPELLRTIVAICCFCSYFGFGILFYFPNLAPRTCCGTAGGGRREEGEGRMAAKLKVSRRTVVCYGENLHVAYTGSAVAAVAAKLVLFVSQLTYVLIKLCIYICKHHPVDYPNKEVRDRDVWSLQYRLSFSMTSTHGDISRSRLKSCIPVKFCKCRFDKKLNFFRAATKLISFLFRTQLPAWIKNQVNVFDDFDRSFRRLKSFFCSVTLKESIRLK